MRLKRHGTHSTYTHGCRCAECTKAHSDYTRDQRALALAAGTLTHGVSSTFDAGCRCGECRDAKSKYRNAQRARAS